MKEPVLLGIDVGTTFCKAAIVSAEGAELSQGRQRTPWQQVPTGAEIAADALLSAVAAAARAAIDQRPSGTIVGVGVTSMAEAGFLLDAAGRPLFPAIAWYDSRSAPESKRLLDELGADRFSGRTGLGPGPMPTIGKYRWLRGHDPATAKGARWLNVADFVVRALGGAEVAERSLASRTGFLDQQTGRWWPDALAWADLDVDRLPPLVHAGERVGRVAGGGLVDAEGAALAVAGHDHLAAAVGAGAVRDGDILNSCGTAEALVRAVKGVAFSQPQGLDLMREAGAAAVMARGAGGGLSSPLWRQIFADALGVGLQLAGPALGAARGAAVRAGLGTGVYDDVDVGMDWASQSIQAPDPAGAAALEPAFTTYTELYPRLRPVFQAGGA